MVFFLNGILVRDYKKNTHNLQLLQNLLPVFQRVLKKIKLSYILPILHELGWFSIDELLNLCDATIIYKCINSLLQPSYKLFFSNVLTLMIIQITQETKTISVYLCAAQRGSITEHLKLGIIPLLLLWECARKQYIILLVMV